MRRTICVLSAVTFLLAGAACSQRGQPAVTSPMKISGAANVFEGTVSYSVERPDGTELDHGFTTATQQLWARWFAFAFTSGYLMQQHGLGHVVVWETSMSDRSRFNVYDVPGNM